MEPIQCVASNGGTTAPHTIDTLVVVLVALAIREVLKALAVSIQRNGGGEKT